MDLTEENNASKSNNWSKVGVFVCFTLSAALLLNSLLNHPNALTSQSQRPSVQTDAVSADHYDR